MSKTSAVIVSLVVMSCLSLFVARSEPVRAQGNVISNVVFNPPSPANVVFSSYIDITYDYSISSSDGARINVTPFANGERVSNFSGQGHSYSAGQGQGVAGFTINPDTANLTNVAVDQVRVQMWDTSGTQLLYETFIPVNYLFVVPTPTPVGTPSNNSITNIIFDPPSPANVVFSSYIDITYDYSISSSDGARINVTPFANGERVSNFSGQGHSYSAGQGQGVAGFTINPDTANLTNVAVDQVRVQMWDTSGTQLLYETFIPVNYLFVVPTPTPVGTPSNNSITNIIFDPPSPANVVFSSYIDITYDYSISSSDGARINVTPFANGERVSNFSGQGHSYSAGQGQGVAGFTINPDTANLTNVAVDQVRVQMWDTSRTQLLYETFIPVNYQFVAPTPTPNTTPFTLTPTPTATATPTQPAITSTPTPTTTPRPTSAPILQVSPSQLVFNATEGGNNPSAKSLTIKNLISGNLNWTVTSNADWLQINNSSGTVPTTVNVSVNVTGLQPATYLGQLTFTAPEATNSPQIVQISLVIDPAVNNTERYIDLTISLYKTASDREPYERILRYFADSIYEMSNGVHKIRNITIYQNRTYRDQADVIWNQSEWPRAIISAYGVPGYSVIFGDNFNTRNFLEGDLEGRCGGYILGHEWGHYYYGLFDEYRLREGDVAVKNSVMNDQWQACYQDDMNYLNFSIAKNNTRKTEQHRVYEASGWETLARPLSRDPRNGYRSGSLSRPYYPELAKVAPGTGQDAPLELPNQQTQARNALQIRWITSNARNEANPYRVSINSVTGYEITYPEPVILVASVLQDNPIAKTAIQAITTHPDGTQTTLNLKDDGQPPDLVVDDGVYSGYLSYTQSGPHQVSITFTNPDLQALFTQYAFEHAPDPDGNVDYAPPEPVNEVFTTTASVNLMINGVEADDHGNTIQQATILSVDNIDITGRIETIGDIDMFKITPTETSQLILRLSGFAFDMQPNIRVLATDGTTVIDEFRFTPQGSGYFFTTLNVTTNEDLYIEVSHQNSQSINGLYDISVGPSLGNNGEPESTTNSTYLPLIVK